MNALVLAAALFGASPHYLSIDEVRQVAQDWFADSEDASSEDYACLCDELEGQQVTIEWVRYWAYYWQHYAKAEREAMQERRLDFTRVGLLRCCCYYGVNKKTFMSPFVPQPSEAEAKPGRLPDRSLWRPS